MTKYPPRSHLREGFPLVYSWGWDAVCHGAEGMAASVEGRGHIGPDLGSRERTGSGTSLQYSKTHFQCPTSSSNVLPPWASQPSLTVSPAGKQAQLQEPMGPLQSCKESVGALRSVIVVAALKRKLSGSKRSSGETENHG